MEAAPEARGASLVAKHASQQLLAQQLRSIERLLAAGTSAAAGPLTARVALESSEWNEDDARRLLREFARYKRMNHPREGGGDGPESRKGDTRRERRRRERGDDDDEEPRRATEKHRSGGKRRRRHDDSGASASSEDDDSLSDSDSEDERRRRRRRKKEKKRKKKEQRKKEKKERRGGGYGSRGVVRDVDVAIGGAKHAEFVAWCSEVKHLGVENMPAYEERALRREFMEDFNTATLVGGDRYYDLAASEAREGRGGGGGGTATAAAANWEDERRRERERERTEAREAEIKRLRAVMKGTGVADAMREQAQLREEMAMMYRVGNMQAAEKLKERLAPDEERFDAETGRYRKRQDKKR